MNTIVINMSNQSSDTTNSTTILAKGLNLAVTLKHLPTENTVRRVKAFITHLPSCKAEEIKCNRAHILKKTHTHSNPTSPAKEKQL
jgi:hypothetical protein